jgi:hypothetical protein
VPSGRCRCETRRTCGGLLHHHAMHCGTVGARACGRRESCTMHYQMSNTIASVVVLYRCKSLPIPTGETTRICPLSPTDPVYIGTRRPSWEQTSAPPANAMQSAESQDTHNCRSTGSQQTNIQPPFNGQCRSHAGYNAHRLSPSCSDPRPAMWGSSTGLLVVAWYLIETYLGSPIATFEMRLERQASGVDLSHPIQSLAWIKRSHPGRHLQRCAKQVRCLTDLSVRRADQQTSVVLELVTCC